MPAILALVETIGLPTSAHNARAMGWPQTRTATVLWPPRTHLGTLLVAGTSQVIGPGHDANRVCCCSGVTVIKKLIALYGRQLELGLYARACFSAPTAA